jgi:hypothetical protein
MPLIADRVEQKESAGLQEVVSIQRRNIFLFFSLYQK